MSAENLDYSVPTQARLAAVRSEVAKAVVGQDAAVTGLVVALLAGGHVLLEGVPGVAKTLLVRALAASLELDTKRIQFTPDLMPGDVTGSLIYDSRTAEFSLRPGPVFTNLLLADEINRTPPKTQAALLEAMEERQVSIDGTPRALPEPFMVIATQNPVEYEGTYPLPEAQLDRFLMKLVLPLPERDTEIEVLTRHANGFNPRDLVSAGLQAVTNAQDLSLARSEVAKVGVGPEVTEYIVDLVRLRVFRRRCHWGYLRVEPPPCWLLRGLGLGLTGALLSLPTTSKTLPCPPCVTALSCVLKLSLKGSVPLRLSMACCVWLRFRAEVNACLPLNGWLCCWPRVCCWFFFPRAQL